MLTWLFPQPIAFWVCLPMRISSNIISYPISYLLKTPHLNLRYTKTHSINATASRASLLPFLEVSLFLKPVSYTSDLYCLLIVSSIKVLLL